MGVRRRRGEARLRGVAHGRAVVGAEPVEPLDLVVVDRQCLGGNPLRLGFIRGEDPVPLVLRDDRHGPDQKNDQDGQATDIESAQAGH